MAWTSKRLYAPLLAVILLFFGFHLFVLDLMVEKNEQYGSEVSHTLWISAQLETEYLRFLSTLDRYSREDGTTDSEVLQRRFDILTSRLPLFLQGVSGGLFGQIEGVQPTALSLQAMIERLESSVQILSPSDTVAYEAIRDELDSHRGAVHKLVLDTFLAEEAVTAQILRRNEYVYWLLVIALVGAVVSGTVLVVVLIRQVRRAETAKAEARREGERAMKADQAKSEFLANMSHELRTPLNAIVGFSETINLEILGPIGNDRYRTYITDIHECAMLLARLIEDILDLSKVEAGKYDLKEESVDLAQLAQASIHLFQQQARADGLSLSTEIPEGLPPLCGDRRVLQQIILNLLSNAIKFTPSGGQVSLRMTPHADKSITLSVADTGIGLSESDLEVALTPFGQVANVMTRGHSGTGLGLPLAKSLVELHEGSMKIESQLDVGTRVTVTLPPNRLSHSLLAA